MKRRNAFWKNAFFLFIFILLIGLFRPFLRHPSQPTWIEPSINTTSWWNLQSVNCHSFFNSKQPDLSIDQMRMWDERAERQANFIEKDVFRKETESCDSYLTRRHFVRESLSEEEKNFPIAFSLIVFKDYPQVEMLLRTIYRPEHTICIHVDSKVQGQFLLAVKQLAECFPDKSVFLAENPMNVNWGTMSVLDAELLCMKQLWDLIGVKKWKYFINLTGQEFPLRTNLELVKILKIFNGANSLEGTVKRRNAGRYPKTKFPFPLQWTKGSVHITVSATFVNFTLHSSESQAIIESLRQNKVHVPDETLFATLNHNPHLKTPGAYLLEPETNPDKYPFITRLKNWNSWPFHYPCKSGRIVRGICIWGLADISFIASRPELFTNKFHWNFQNLALQCLQEKYWNRTLSDTLFNDVHLDLNYYQNLSFVQHHQ